MGISARKSADFHLARKINKKRKVDTPPSRLKKNWTKYMSSQRPFGTFMSAG